MKKISAVDMLANCDSYSFIADKSTGLFHNATCSALTSISSQNMQGCGKKPEQSGFRPCPNCLPQREAEYKYAHYKDYRQKYSGRKTKTKAMVIKEQLASICNAYGVHIEFSGSCAYVTTVAGEWYFYYCDRPIRLHHKNDEQRFDSTGKHTGYYHTHDITYSSPAHALAYIYRHEQATVKRIMAGEFEEETEIRPDKKHITLEERIENYYCKPLAEIDTIKESEHEF